MITASSGFRDAQARSPRAHTLPRGPPLPPKTSPREGAVPVDVAMPGKAGKCLIACRRQAALLLD